MPLIQRLSQRVYESYILTNLYLRLPAWGCCCSNVFMHGVIGELIHSYGTCVLQSRPSFRNSKDDMKQEVLKVVTRKQIGRRNS